MTCASSVNHGTGWRAIRTTTATSFGSSTRYVSFIPPPVRRTTRSTARPQTDRTTESMSGRGVVAITSECLSPSVALEELPAAERAAKGEEGVVELRVPLVADQQAVVPMEPGHVPLGHPAAAAQPLARLDARARDARGDVAAAQQGAVRPGRVGLVGVQLGRAPAGVAPPPVGVGQGGDGGGEPRGDRPP